jgi:hypothetical protein
MEVSNEEAYRIALKKERMSKKFAGERCAFVSPKDLTFGATRVHQALIDDDVINTEVFRRIEDALEWLGVELDIIPE